MSREEQKKARLSWWRRLGITANMTVWYAGYRYLIVGVDYLTDEVTLMKHRVSGEVAYKTVSLLQLDPERLKRIDI